ncbi:MAG: hypothetical protein K2K83_01715 [Rikenella sp.]|nr:hypothetical protein [Rikenella sp.]
MKTLFDPCPAGWRVPQNGEGANNPWSGFATVEAPWTDDGRRWSAPLVSGGQAWYAATGLRFYSGGIMSGVNSSAHYQSAAPIPVSNSTRVFYFVTTEVIINRSAHRTHGLSVRCVRE